jgi:hypothetical protein
MQFSEKHFRLPDCRFTENAGGWEGNQHQTDGNRKSKMGENVRARLTPRLRSLMERSRMFPMQFSENHFRLPDCRFTENVGG